MNFTIDRSKWRCGKDRTSSYSHGEGTTLLLNKEGYQCCLGQVCEQLEIKGLLGLGLPYKSDSLPQFQPFHEIFPDSFVSTAVGINDDIVITLKLKEQKLIALFEEYGHQLTFIGEYNTTT